MIASMLILILIYYAISFAEITLPIVEILGMNINILGLGK